MEKDGQNLYFDDVFMKQPNHERVVRLLHEMDLQPQGDRRHQDAVHQLEQRRKKTDLQSLATRFSNWQP